MSTLWEEWGDALTIPAASPRHADGWRAPKSRRE